MTYTWHNFLRLTAKIRDLYHSGSNFLGYFGDSFTQFTHLNLCMILLKIVPNFKNEIYLLMIRVVKNVSELILFRERILSIGIYTL